MSNFSYLDMLHLVVPEVIVVIAALCVLSLDLMLLRTSEPRPEAPLARYCRLPGAQRRLPGSCILRNLQMFLTECSC